MTLDEMIAKTQALAEVVGPNVYLQAVLIATAFIAIGKIADWVVSGIIGRFARKSTNDFDDQLVELVHRPIFLSFALIGLGLATRRLGMAEAPTFITIGILKTIAIFVWYSTAMRLMALVVQTFNRTSTRKVVQTGMLSLLHIVMKIVALALAGYFLFLAWNINVSAWLASAGIVGLALSFAAKDTLSNLFAGVSIIMDAPYKVGDFIILESGERGVVTDIGLRSTRILTRDDIEITVPNGIIGNGKIINEAGGPTSNHRIRVAVGVAYGSDIDEVIEVLSGAAGSLPEILKSPAPRVRFRAFGQSSLDFELLGWIARPVDRGRITHELNCAVYKALNKNGIVIPFPQRDLYIKSMPAT